jgi:cytochrome c oxidase cbb3-type subunit 3
VSSEREIVEYPRPDQPPRDGIDEHDHPIPRWFNVTFAASIVFALLYFPYYTWLSDWSSHGAWEAEVAAAEERTAALRASLPQQNPFRGDATAIAQGKEVWTTICVSCHLPDARGLVGPSLVDPYWKYGSDDAALFETVSNGRPGGMPPWGPALGSEKIWKALAYLETLPKTSEPGLGAPDFAPPTP